ncbi:unannotated protein [freshwater metagenome]|uniref:Unannotated protein n=1 Tax=freshwater metagenome TaxID=449393 RepID=A0A6J7GB82_9ZZZZ
MVSPLGGVEHHEEDGSEDDAEQSPGRPVRDAGNAPASQEHEQRGEQAQEHREEREAAGHGTVDGLDEEVVVPQEVLVPRLVGADDGAHSGGLDDGREGLVGEHDDEDEYSGRGQRCQHGEGADLPVASDHDASDGSGSGEKRCHTHQSGGCGGQGEGTDEAGRGCGKQSAGGDGAFDRAPGQQCAEGDDRLGTQSVVVREPEGEEHQSTGPQRHVRFAHRASESRHHLAADHHPAQDSGDQGGQAHPRACGRDLGEDGQDVVVPAERCLGDAEPAEVVGHVAGMFGRAGHGEQVAVVGGVGADEVPADEDSENRDVDAGELPPVRREEAAVRAAVGAVEPCERAHGQQRAGDRQHHDQRLQDGRSRREAGVDVDGDRHVGRGRATEITEDADDLRTEIAVEPTLDGLAALVGQSGEGCGGVLVVRGDLDGGAARALDVGARCRRDDDVAVEDIDVRLADANEQAVEGGTLTLRGCGRQQQPARRG